MSYDVYLEAYVDTGGEEPVAVQLLSCWNYTTNCAPMWRAAGADLAEFEGRTGGDCATELSSAIEEMKRNPEKYIAMNPDNGWGSYESLLPELERLLEAFTSHPKATVRISR